MSEPAVTYESDGGVVTVTLQRPVLGASAVIRLLVAWFPAMSTTVQAT